MRYFLCRKLPSDRFEIIGYFEDIEKVIDIVSIHWVAEWANGHIFVLENIPLKLVVS